MKTSFKWVILAAVILLGFTTMQVMGQYATQAKGSILSEDVFGFEGGINKWNVQEGHVTIQGDKVAVGQSALKINRIAGFEESARISIKDKIDVYAGSYIISLDYFITDNNKYKKVTFIFGEGFMAQEVDFSLSNKTRGQWNTFTDTYDLPFNVRDVGVAINVKQQDNPGVEGDLYIDNIALVPNTITGVEDIVAYEYKVYPNPAADKIYVDAPTSSVASVYNVTGTLMKTIEVMSAPSTINVDDLASGVYIVKVIFEDETTVRRIQIQ